VRGNNHVSGQGRQCTYNVMWHVRVTIVAMENQQYVLLAFLHTYVFIKILKLLSFVSEI
jgi:hypothetical protein